MCKHHEDPSRKNHPRLCFSVSDLCHSGKLITAFYSLLLWLLFFFFDFIAFTVLKGSFNYLPLQVNSLPLPEDWNGLLQRTKRSLLWRWNSMKPVGASCREHLECGTKYCRYSRPPLIRHLGTFKKFNCQKNFFFMNKCNYICIS